MNALFGQANSFLGGDDDDELPVVIGSTIVEEASDVIVLICHSCETSYDLPDEIDDARLLEMCPRCAHVFSSRPDDAEQTAASANG